VAGKKYLVFCLNSSLIYLNSAFCKCTTMFRINEKGPLERLRILSVKLGGDFREGHNTAVLELDNANGKGRIFTYEMMPGLSMSAYNINLASEVNFRIGGGPNSPILMVYCLKGHFYHKTSEGNEQVRIARDRNIILSPADDQMSTIVLPEKTDVRLCAVAIEKSDIPSKDLIRRDGLKLILKDLYSKAGPQGYFENFAAVRSKVRDHVKILIENPRTDVIGKLVTEAAVLNMMAAQLEAHERSIVDASEASPLKNKELERILAGVSDMRLAMDRPHTIKLFASRTALSPRKLQDGFRFLFGRSFAGFLKDLRLEMAREQLETTDLPIMQIADNVGIRSKSHLSRIFRERFGMLPFNYRESLINATRSFELSYRSSTSPLVGESDVQSMVERADMKNIENGVGGCLIYFEDHFFQILEGPKRKVLQVFERIKNDPRHAEVETLWRGPRDARVFDEDGMFFLSDREIALKLSTGRNLSVDMSTLVGENGNLSVTNKMFWQRIRNRILVSNVA